MRRKRRSAKSTDFRDDRLPPEDDFGIFTVGVFTPMANEDFCPPIGRVAGNPVSFVVSAGVDGGFTCVAGRDFSSALGGGAVTAGAGEVTFGET